MSIAHGLRSSTGVSCWKMISRMGIISAIDDTENTADRMLKMKLSTMLLQYGGTKRPAKLKKYFIWRVVVISVLQKISKP